MDWSGVDAPGAVERAQDGLYAADADGRVVYCNGSFSDLVGLDPARPRGRDAGTDPDGAVRVELAYRRGDGGEVPLSVTFTPRPGGGLVASARNVTECERGAEELELLKQVLERVFRHNLRNELTLVTGHAEFIADRTEGAASDLAAGIYRRL